MNSDRHGRLWILAPRAKAQTLRQELQRAQLYDATLKIVLVSNPVPSAYRLLSPTLHDNSQQQGLASGPHKETQNGVDGAICALPTSVLIKESAIAELQDASFAEAATESAWPVTEIESDAPSHMHVLFDIARTASGAVAWRAEGMNPSAPSSMEDRLAKRVKVQGNPVQAVLRNWTKSLPEEVTSLLPCNPESLWLGSVAFQIYHPMLLLAEHPLASSRWNRARDHASTHLHSLYTMLRAALNVTHIAVNAPIPASIEPDTYNENCMRLPRAFQPLDGDFGNPAAEASSEAFEQALWATPFQNGIWQVFAPVHTMFSRGNFKEKARILDIAVKQAADETFTAVDLYAGIGYFAFSYAKAGAQVLCWEINPWSIEGFRRGALRNGMSVRLEELETWNTIDGHGDKMREQLLMFPMSNQHALGWIQRWRTGLPPIRHINCGYLPSSIEVLRDAARMLDPAQGGWIHAHENVAEDSIASRGAALAEHIMADQRDTRTQANCIHTERVKSYAPGVVHCVFDITIEPMA